MAVQFQLKKFGHLIFLIVISFQLNNFVVSTSSDFISILDKNTNQIVFQAATHFIRSSKCGSFIQKEAYFVVSSDPLLGCESIDPISPPISFLNELYRTLKTIIADIILLAIRVDLKEYFENTPWVLITKVEENGFCNLETKLKNIANAGYSSVLLATNKRQDKMTREKLEFNLKLSTKRTGYNFLDIHLIKPWYIRKLSKYADLAENNGTVFTILGTHGPVESQTCKDFYKETIFSQLFKQVSKTNILLSIVGTLMLSSPLIFLIMYQKGLFSKRKSYRESQFSYQRWYPYQEYHSEDDDDDDNYTDTPPPSSPRPSPPPPQETELHLQLLDIQLGSEPLTTARVNAAYKAKALSEHPDRHEHLRIIHPEEYRKQNEKFTEIISARDYLLLKVCID